MGLEVSWSLRRGRFVQRLNCMLSPHEAETGDRRIGCQCPWNSLQTRLCCDIYLGENYIPRGKMWLSQSVVLTCSFTGAFLGLLVCYPSAPLPVPCGITSMGIQVVCLLAFLLRHRPAAGRGHPVLQLLAISGEGYGEVGVLGHSPL